MIQKNRRGLLPPDVQRREGRGFCAQLPPSGAGGQKRRSPLASPLRCDGPIGMLRTVGHTPEHGASDVPQSIHVSVGRARLRKVSMKYVRPPNRGANAKSRSSHIHEESVVTGVNLGSVQLRLVAIRGAVDRILTKSGAEKCSGAGPPWRWSGWSSATSTPSSVVSERGVARRSAADGGRRADACGGGRGATCAGPPQCDSMSAEAALAQAIFSLCAGVGLRATRRSSCYLVAERPDVFGASPFDFATMRLAIAIAKKVL